MRSVFAHDYGEIDFNRVGDAVSKDILLLRKFCWKTIVLYSVAEQEEGQDKNLER